MKHRKSGARTHAVEPIGIEQQQDEPSHSAAANSNLSVGRDRVFASVWTNAGSTRLARRGVRLLGVAITALGILLTMTGCGGTPEHDLAPAANTTEQTLETATTPPPETTTPPPETTTPPPETTTPPWQTPAPRELVGTWHNDPDDIDWYLTIAIDGTYTLYSTDIDVYDEGQIDTSGGMLRLITATQDPRPSRLVVAPEGCDWKVENWELYGYLTTQLQFCNRGVWVMS